MLTKAQKMKMVSDAIDKGFNIELTRFNANYNDTDELLKIFNELPVKMNGHYMSKSAWVKINLMNFSDKFEASIHLV